MNRDVLSRLETMPELLRRVAAGLSDEHTRRRPADGAFAFVEHAWHLADLEREGYGARITRLLTENAPTLPDFDGERAAREREYHLADPVLGVELFARARRRNLERLAGLDDATLSRAGTQDGVGAVTLGRVPHMMDAHDRAHAEELIALLEEIGAGASLLPALRAHAAAPRVEPPAGSQSRPKAA
jgi:hypothetical protein